MKTYVKDFIKDSTSRGMTPHSISTYTSNIRIFLKFVGDPFKVDNNILRDFLDYLREDMVYTRGKIRKKGVCNQTVHAYFSAIASYYDYLLYAKKLANNPVPQFRRRYLARNKKQFNGENSRQLLTLEQVKQLFSLKMHIREKVVLIILCKCGMRRGELISLDLSDLNLEKGEIILKPKAKRTNRLVFFDDEAAQVLKEYLKWRAPRAKSSALFISPAGARIHKDEPNRILAKYARKLGFHNPRGPLNKRATPHCFRHFFTTILRKNNMRREFIQELRGDKRRETVDIYDHIDLIELKEAYLRCIPKLFK
ncbi:MAG: recombinase [Candidatus Methanoperedens sp.]|nr:recombinase [Candidatus Methanoperedens sp.]